MPLKAGAAVVIALLLAAPRARAQSGAAEAEVTVQGDPLGAPGRRDPTAASSELRREKLAAPGASAADVLARVPGVQVARTGSSSDLATASLRGATSAETPVYLAGVRINDDVTGTADLSRVPLWMIERVEIYRGSAPLEADRLGLGGAIFFEPRTPREPRATVGFGVGSFGERSAWVGVAGGSARASALAAVRFTRSDNDYAYLDDRGTRFDARDDVIRRRQNADARDVDAWTVARFDLGRGATTTVVANAFQREQGVTGLGVVPARAARADVQRFLGGVTTRLPCASEIEACSLELTTSAIASRQDISDPLRELGFLTTDVAETGRRLGQTARVIVHPAAAWTLAAVASGELETLGIDSTNALDAAPVRARRSTGRVAAQVTYDATKRVELTVLGSFACDATTSPPDVTAPTKSPSSGPCDQSEPGARVGARLAATSFLDVFGNVGHYARVPTLGELFGTSASVRGNPALAPETGFTADLGVRARGSWDRVDVSAEVVGFARFAEDLVAYQRSELGVVRPFNVGSARVLGGETTIAARAFDTVRLEAAVTLLDPRDTTAGRTIANDILPFQARFVATPTIEVFRDDPFTWLDRAAILGRFTYRASRVADPAGLEVLPAERSLDLELTFFEVGRRLAERLSITDVLDTQNTDVLGMPLPGRAVHASIEGTW